MTAISSTARAAFSRVRPLVTAGVLGQLVGLLSVPLLTRLYSEAEFGALALMSSVLAIVTPISALRFEMAVPLPESDAEASDVLGLATVVVTALSAVTLVVSAFAVAWWSTMDTGNAAVWVGAISLNLLLSGFYLVGITWLIRREAFRPIAIVGAVQAVTQALAYILVGLVLPSSTGLFIALTIGNVVGIVAVVIAVRACAAPPTIAVTRTALGSSWGRFNRFAIISTPASLLNTVAVELPFLVLARVLTEATFGVLAVARRLTQAPISLLAQAVGQVFFGSSARSKRDQSRVVTRNLVALVTAMTAVSVVALAIYVFVVPPVLDVVFDEGWEQTGRFVQILSFVFLAQGIASATSTVVDVAQKQELQLLRDGVRLVSTGIAAYFVVQMTNTAVAAVVGFGIVGVANAVFAVVISFVAARHVDASGSLSDTREPASGGA